MDANRAKIRAQNRTAMDRYRRRHPDRVEAHRKTSDALRLGKLVRQPCRECGGPKGQAHHPDYRRPLYVEWLCRPCHEAHHHHTPRDTRCLQSPAIALSDRAKALEARKEER